MRLLIMKMLTILVLVLEAEITMKISLFFPFVTVWALHVAQKHPDKERQIIWRSTMYIRYLLNCLLGICCLWFFSSDIFWGNFVGRFVFGNFVSEFFFFRNSFQNLSKNLKRHRNSSCFDNSGSLIALFVPKISPSVKNATSGQTDRIAYSIVSYTKLF